MTNKADVSTVQSAITDEIFYAFGFKHRGVLRQSLGWAFGLPTRRFARMMVAVDDAVAEGGAPAGCQVMMDALNVQITARGLENIPPSGPVLILANHPGAYDSMAIGSRLPRKDLNAVVSATRLYGALPHVRPKLLFVSKKPSEDMATLRGAIDRLNQGESLLQFGSGRIEPDPATDPVGDDVFARWSSSLEILLRKVPGLAVVPTIASGVLLKRFRDSILTRFRKKDMDRRRLAEFIQVIQQLIFPKSVDAQTSISFGPPFTLEALLAESDGRRLMPAAIERVKQVLEDHLLWITDETLA
jgi:1-acyl-sn-glycerol-3-phosphate acyltransferase